jgi:hypothetical protein
MRLLVILTLLLCSVTPGFAAPSESTGLPVQAPALPEVTIIQGTGLSSGSSQNQSLACDVAHKRAMSELMKGLAITQARNLVTAEELTVAVMAPAERVWNASQGKCLVRLKLTVPVLPKTGTITTAHERLY